MARQPLNRGASTVLDASGNGEVRLGPTQGPTNWYVRTVRVRVSSPGTPPIPRVDLYLNTTRPEDNKDGSYDGSDNASDVDYTLVQGNQIIAVWEGGNPGDTATLTVTGEME